MTNTQTDIEQYAIMGQCMTVIHWYLNSLVRVQESVAEQKELSHKLQGGEEEKDNDHATPGQMNHKV